MDESIGLRYSALLRERDRLRAELESWTEAFGLLSTLHGTMAITVNDPMGMAKQIESHVRSELTEARKPDCNMCAYRLACRTLIKDDCLGGDQFLQSRDPLRLYEKEEK